MKEPFLKIQWRKHLNIRHYPSHPKPTGIHTCTHTYTLTHTQTQTDTQRDRDEDGETNRESRHTTHNWPLVKMQRRRAGGELHRGRGSYSQSLLLPASGLWELELVCISHGDTSSLTLPWGPMQLFFPWAGPWQPSQPWSLHAPAFRAVSTQILTFPTKCILSTQFQECGQASSMLFYSQR